MNLFTLDVPAPSTSALSPLASGGGASVDGLSARSSPDAGMAAPFGQMLAHALRQLPGQDLAAAGGLAPGGAGEGAEGLEIDEIGKNDLLDGVGDAAWLTVAWAGQQPGLAGVAGGGLQAQSLGATMRLITPASAPPDDNSLAAFARAQGLDEQATRWLLSLPAGPSGPMLKVIGAEQTMGQAMGLAMGLAGSPAPQPGLLPAQAQAPGLGGQMPSGATAAMATAADGDGPGVAAVAAGLVPASLQLAGLMGGREREPAPAPVTELPASASVIAGLRKTFLMPGAPAPMRSAPGTAAPDAASPSFVDMPLDLEIDLPEGLQGPDALEALQAWLEQVQSDDGSPTPSTTHTTSSSETFGSRLGALGSSALVDRGASAADEAQQRTEQHQALAQRMGEAMAQRLIAQVERGHWHVRFMLRPQSLGHVEVELQMRAGELEAAFRAPQALTRELLAESLPRLREVLTQMGMDVAHLHVGARQGQSGGGNSTPRQDTPSRSGSANQEAAAPVPDSTTRPSRRGLDGWDVLV